MQLNNYRLSPACLLTGMLLIIPAIAPAEIYKWIDRQGRTHYSEKPPAKVQSEELRIEQSSSSPVDHVSQQEHRIRQQKLLRAYEEERLQRDNNRLKAKHDKERRVRQCSAARDRQRVAEGGYRLYDYDKQGNRIYLDAQAVSKARERAVSDVRRLCK